MRHRCYNPRFDFTRLICSTALLLLAALSSPAQACMVCIPFPEGTAIDDLLDADAVVLARENPHKPFSYVAIETLRGELEDPAIDLFVNSSTRRRLSLDPDYAMVLVRLRNSRPSQPGERYQWRSIGFASDDYEAIVRATLKNAATWQSPGGDEHRYDYFMRRLASNELEVQKLAYLEVGKAPYEVIRRADAFVDSARVHAFLADPLYLEWRRLYILLLGVDASATDAAIVRETLQNLAYFDRTLNLSAWATALIEVDGEAGIEWLEKQYVGNPGRAQDRVLETLKALSTQGSVPLSPLRLRIVESYRLLLETHPQLAGWIARDLVSWQEWQLAEALADLRADNIALDGPSGFAIDYYLGRARHLGKLP